MSNVLSPVRKKDYNTSAFSAGPSSSVVQVVSESNFYKDFLIITQGNTNNITVSAEISTNGTNWAELPESDLCTGPLAINNKDGAIGVWLPAAGCQLRVKISADPGTDFLVSIRMENPIMRYPS